MTRWCITREEAHENLIKFDITRKNRAIQQVQEWLDDNVEFAVNINDAIEEAMLNGIGQVGVTCKVDQTFSTGQIARVYRDLGYVVTAIETDSRLPEEVTFKISLTWR